MESNHETTETNFSNLELTKLVVLDENETKETYGGGHLEWIDGKFVWVD